MRGVKAPRAQGDMFIDGHDLDTTERQPSELLLDISGRPALVSNQDVEHLRHVDRADPRPILVGAQERLDLRSGRLAGQGGDDSLRIEDGQGRPPRSASTADSSSRTSVRI